MNLGTTALIETWRYVNGNTLVGEVVQKPQSGVQKTVETIELRCSSDTCLYLPTLPNQNGGRPIPFRISEQTDTSFFAINPAHDFPKGIRYTLKSGGVLEAQLEGLEKGKPVKQTFEMRKL